MNQTTANSTAPCELKTLSDVLWHAVEHNYNITYLTIECPEICSLSWGTGNADLSGIGVRSSSWYTI